VVLLSHVHNRDWPNLSGGAALSRDELAELFPDGRIYADEVLTAAALEGERPVAGYGLQHTEAFAVAAGSGARPPGPAEGPLTRPAPGTSLRRNPLCGTTSIDWPSDRYRREYSGRATYRPSASLPDIAVMAPIWHEAAARRELVDLPERW
jgi:hypothetical protein